LLNTKAKYIEVTEGIKEAIWLKGILSELYPTQNIKGIFSHNQSSIHWAMDQVHQER